MVLWRHAVVLLIALIGTAGCSEPAQSSVGDAEMVYCLAAARAEDLAQAALIIGVVDGIGQDPTVVHTGGEHLAVDVWARSEKADFSLACAVLLESKRLPRASRPVIDDRAWGLITLAAGALLAFVASEFRARAELRGARRKELAIRSQELIAELNSHFDRLSVLDPSRPDPDAAARLLGGVRSLIEIRKAPIFQQHRRTEVLETLDQLESELKETRAWPDDVGVRSEKLSKIRDLVGQLSDITSGRFR